MEKNKEHKRKKHILDRTARESGYKDIFDFLNKLNKTKEK